MKNKSSKEIIRASEIGTYMFCNRAWWLRRVEEQESTNFAEMARGTRRHEQHARSVRGSDILQRLAYGLIALALLLIIIYFLL